MNAVCTHRGRAPTCQPDLDAVQLWVLDDRFRRGSPGSIADGLAREGEQWRTLYRQEEPLPQSLLVSDQQYQNSLLTSFESGLMSEGRQLKVGKIDGQDALILVGAARVPTLLAIVHF